MDEVKAREVLERKEKEGSEFWMKVLRQLVEEPTLAKDSQVFEYIFEEKVLDREDHIIYFLLENALNTETICEVVNGYDWEWQEGEEVTEEEVELWRKVLTGKNYL